MPSLNSIVSRAKKEFNTIKQDLNLGNNSSSYSSYSQQQQSGQTGYPGQNQQYNQQPGGYNGQQQGWLGQSQPYGQPQQAGYPGQGQQQQGQYGMTGQQPPPPHWHQNQGYPGQPNNPPPVPYSSHPGGTQQPASYGSQPPFQQQQSGTPNPTNPQQPHAPNTSLIYQANFHPQQPVSQEWQHELGNNNGWGNNEIQHYTSSPANSIHTPEGHLLIRAIVQPSNPDPAQRFTSARLLSHHNLSSPRGYLTATILVPSAPGIWPAFWLLPAEPMTWPDDGEIDIAESWQGEPVNHSCLHWGHYNARDSNKHKVIDTPIPNLGQRWVRYEFAWDQSRSDQRGGGHNTRANHNPTRMLWWIDNQPVMRAALPPRTLGRPLEDYIIVMNIAMGGTVCNGQKPREGVYEMRVCDLRIGTEVEGVDGWGRFERDWGRAKEGHGC